MDTQFNFKFNVGDYVETKDGHVGYIIDATPSELALFYWKQTDGLKMFTGTQVNVEKSFKRIGKYDFTKNINNLTIQPIDSSYSILPYLKDKINEIIDYINKNELKNKELKND